MPNARALLRLHLELECKRVTDDGFLDHIPCPDPDDLPRFYVARLPDGYIRYFRRDIPAVIREQLCALTFETAFANPDSIQRILVEHAPCANVWMGKSYIFPALPSPAEFPDCVQLSASHRELAAQFDPRMDFTRRAIFAMIVSGRIVATCESSRENEQSTEAWVRTHPDFRRRGYARQAVSAWAHQLMTQGKVPFYSHKMENTASQSLAHSPGLTEYLTDAAFE